MKSKITNNLTSLLIEPENDVERQALKSFVNMQGNKEYTLTIQNYGVKFDKQGVSSMLIGYNKAYKKPALIYKIKKFWRRLV